jgi:hypothetical protein
MRAGQAVVDRLDHVHRQNVAIGLSRELIGAVACPAGNGKRIAAGAQHETDRLVRVGQKLAVIQLAFGA